MNEIYQAVKAVIQEALQWIWDQLVNFILSLVKTIFDMLKDLFFWTIETIAELVIPLLDMFGEMLTFNPASYFNDLPSEVKNVVGLVGLGEAMTIIIAGIVIRMLLQLIPFVRLGS